MKTTDESLVFIAPRDPEEVLNSLSEDEFSKDEILPYWAESWPSAEPLLKYLETSDLVLADKNVCELGAGLGIISSFIGKMRGKVIATDIVYESCKYAKINIEKYSKNGMVLCCDWRFSVFKEKFDLIIAADILYERRWIEPVVNFVSQNMADYGRFVISDPQRTFWYHFKKRMREKKFAVENKVIVENGKSNVEIIQFSMNNR